jgi:hypothetical protein
MVKSKSALNNLITYLVSSTVFAMTLFVIFNNVQFFLAYGAQERSIFFGHQIDISSNNGTSELPQIAAQGNNVYVVWQDNTNGNNEIMFTHSSDNGNNFAKVINLSNNNGTSELPQIATQGNNVYVAWQDNTNGNNEIMFTHSSDNGNNFAKVINLSNNNGTSELPQIATQGKNVYVVWQDNTTGNNDIMFKSSPFNGTKFRSTRNLSNNNGTSELPQIAAQGNNVYIVWQDNTTGNYDIFFKRSPNKGSGFRSVDFMHSDGNSQLPRIAARGNNVYIVWQDNSTGNYDIFFKSSSSNATKFKSLRNLSNNSGTSEFPQIAVSSTDAYIIWKDNETGLDRIFFKHGQKDNGTDSLRFGPLNQLHHSGEVSGAKIITGPGVFYGVWSALLNKYNASTIEFYPFMLFEDYSGDSIPLTSLSSNESLSNPDIAVNHSNTYLVWENKTIGNGDIFFKRFSSNFFDRR